MDLIVDMMYLDIIDQNMDMDMMFTLCDSEIYYQSTHWRHLDTGIDDDAKLGPGTWTSLCT